MASEAPDGDSAPLYDLTCTDCAYEATVEGGFVDALDVAKDHQEGSGVVDSEHFVDLELRDDDAVASPD